jgi:hypothetical protein
MITAAALCPAPPLLARELTGADPVMPELRQVCREAAAGLLRGRPDVIAVVGAAAETRTWEATARLDLSPYAPAIGPNGAADLPLLPLPLGLGARLLDQAGYAGRRILQSIGQDDPAGRCAEVGAQLASSAGRVALLVMADGSARRGPKAPGHLDERSAAFDAGVERAVRDGDLGTLLTIDQALARDLMATGRPAWQVLAGALSGVRPAAEIRYSGDPFGVTYLVASLQPPESSRSLATAGSPAVRVSVEQCSAQQSSAEQS